MPNRRLIAIDTNAAPPLVEGENLAARTKQRSLLLTETLDIATAA